MESDIPGNNPGQMTAKSASSVGVASIVSAIAGIVILLITSRYLSPEDNAEFLAFWAALFFVCGVLSGIQTETTRAVGAAQLHRTLRPQGARVLVSALIVGASVALVLLVVSPLLGVFVFKQNTVLVVGALVITALIFPVHSTLAGSVQGLRKWSLFARLVSLEALLRLGAIGVAAFFAAPLIGVELACLVALAAWLIIFVTSKDARTALRSRGDVALSKLLGNTGHALISAASSSALIVAFPLLLKLTTSESEYALSAPLLLAISLTRAPIMVPLQAFQGVAITHVLSSRQAGWKALQRPIALLFGGGLVAAIAAWLVGPYIMLVFGPQYQLEGWLLAALTMAAVLMAVLTLLGTIVIALGRHRAYSSGWAVATVVAVLVLLLPFSTEIRSVVSLVMGPVAGITVHLLALRRYR